jgi:hypothetical protein
MGTVRVAVQGDPAVGNNPMLFSSENHARIVTANGTVAADWKLSVDSAIPVRVPEGEYTLSAFTVFFADVLDCVDDPARPGQQRCFQPTLQPGQICGIPIEVSASRGLDAVFTVLADGRCRLDAAPPPVPDATN